jgi:hypothetical protein
MLKSYIRYVRSQIFPRINVEKLIYPYGEIEWQIMQKKLQRLRILTI